MTSRSERASRNPKRELVVYIVNTFKLQTFYQCSAKRAIFHQNIKVSVDIKFRQRHIFSASMAQKWIIV